MLIGLNGGAHVGKPQKAIKLVLSIFNLEQETHNLTKKVTTFLVLYTVFTNFCNKREIVFFATKWYRCTGVRQLFPDGALVNTSHPTLHSSAFAMIFYEIV